MDVVAPLVADGELAHAVQPGSGALHLPAMPSQALDGVDAPTRDAGLNVAQSQVPADEAVVVRFVRVRLVRPRAPGASRISHEEAVRPWHEAGAEARCLARHRGAVPSLPAPVRVEPVEDKGSLLILTPERFTVSNPEHLALATDVRERLERAGLLQPLSK